MKSVLTVLNSWITKWLDCVIEMDDKGHSAFLSPAARLPFRVLTPSVQRRIDESA